MNIWHIAAKDLLLLIRDRRAVVVLIALPLVFIAIIGMSTGQMLGWRNENEQLRLVVVNESGAAQPDAKAVDADEESPATASDDDVTQLAARIIERLQKRKGVAVTTVQSMEAARQLLIDEHYTAAVHIGPEFTQRVDEMRPGDVLDAEGSGLAANLGTVDIHIETTDPPSNAGALARLIVHGEVLSVVAPYVMRKNPTIRHAMRVRAHAGATSEREVETVPDQPEWTGEYGDIVYQKIVPAYTVMFAFFLVTLMSRSFLTERELGTFRRLKATPVSSGALIFGKVLPFYLVSLLQSALLFLFGRILFGMSFGPKPWLLLPVIFATSAAATGLGMLIATIVRSDAQVTSVATLVILAMAGISGCFMPRDWLPDAMRTISLGTPHAWALIAYDQILNARRPDLVQVWRCCGWLLAFAASYFALGWLRFRTLPG